MTNQWWYQPQTYHGRYGRWKMNMPRLIVPFVNYPNSFNRVTENTVRDSQRELGELIAKAHQYSGAPEIEFEPFVWKAFPSTLDPEIEWHIPSKTSSWEGADGMLVSIKAGFTEFRRIMPHPLSKTSRKRIGKHIGGSLQIIDAGIENNWVQMGSEVKVHPNYTEALRKVEAFTKKQVQRFKEAGQWDHNKCKLTTPFDRELFNKLMGRDLHLQEKTNA